MEMKTMKRFGAMVVAAVLCLSFSAPLAWADAVDATAQIDLTPVEGQSAVDVTVKAGDATSDVPPTLRDVTTFSLALEVQVQGSSEQPVTANFAFSDAVRAMNPAILRPNAAITETSGSHTIRMNLYVAGVEDAFASKSLDVGRLTLSIPEGQTVQAKVLVPEEPNALGLVDSSYAETTVPTERLFVPETPTVDVGASTVPPKSSSSSASSSSSSDIIGQTPDTNPKKNLPNTGDTMMPVIIGLVCVAVAAVVIVVIALVRRRKLSATDAAAPPSEE